MRPCRVCRCPYREVAPDFPVWRWSGRRAATSIRLSAVQKGNEVEPSVAGEGLGIRAERLQPRFRMLSSRKPDDPGGDTALELAKLIRDILMALCCAVRRNGHSTALSVSRRPFASRSMRDVAKPDGGEPSARACALIVPGPVRHLPDVDIGIRVIESHFTESDMYREQNEYRFRVGLAILRPIRMKRHYRNLCLMDWQPQ